jgi:hypothetical protein
MSEPESIELDGVSYVPRLWLRGHRDALDTALAQLAHAEQQWQAAEARVAELDAAARAVVAASDAIDHDICYQGVICAIVPVQAWRALATLLPEEGT